MKWGTDVGHQHSCSAATLFHSSPWSFLWSCQTNTQLYKPIKSGSHVKICFLNPLCFWPYKLTLVMKSIFPFIHFIPSVWRFDGRKWHEGGVSLLVHVLMFNYKLRCLPPSVFFSSSPLWSSQTEPESDSNNKSPMEPGSSQHHSWIAWESMWASSSLDNTLSRYQTHSVPHNARWRHLGSGWVSGNGMTSAGCIRQLREHQSRLQAHSDTHHMALTFSWRYLPW